MKVWTIQMPEAWESLQNTGYLRADPKFIEPYFLSPYRWLAEQMQLRLGPPPTGIEFPLWVWYQYESERKPRPDLRHAAFLPRGQAGVLLECDCPDQTVLLSDFETWHCVLNDWYLPSDQADELAFETRWGAVVTDNPECASQKRASWQRIFDLDWFDPQQEYARRREDKSIQGTLWEIHLSQVKSIKPFVAR